MKSFTLAEKIPEKIKERLKNFPILLSQLLFNRGIDDEKKVVDFLDLDYEKDIHDPFLMSDMEKVVQRIYKIIKNEEKICIYSDYDCDGIPGAVVLSDLFEKINYKNFLVYIPDRLNEGYGLNAEAIQKIASLGVRLIFTIDLGITSVTEIDLANSLGLEVIISDHHLPLLKNGEEILPQALAILNPKKKSDSYPEKMLCGAGVVFKFVQAFLIKYGDDFEVKKGWEKWLLDMVGLATLADMVPLLGENRALAFFGLKVLRKSERLGLVELLKKMNIKQKDLTEDDINFMIAPKINVASRLDKPQKAFELLNTKEVKVAKVLVDYLLEINEKRKKIVTRIISDIKRRLSWEQEEKEVLVLGHPQWHVGVLGLVASRIVEEYKKTVFVWGRESVEIDAELDLIENNIDFINKENIHLTLENEVTMVEDVIYKGSCRSVGTVNVFNLMNRLSEDTLLNFGGHELAGGFVVSQEKIHFLEKEINEAYQKEKAENLFLKNDKEIDMSISLEQVNLQNIELINRMAPFGIGNPKPVFLFEKVEINEVRFFGKKKEHLEIILKKNNYETIKAIAFFKNEKSFTTSLEKGKIVDLLATLEKNTFAGKNEARLRIEDVF